jgi:two-component system CheB/CheR fusion protein
MARVAKSNGGNGAKKEEPPSETTVPVVGIGASAGGLSALETLLPAIAPDSGLAYVIVQHLDPDHESVLASLLERLATVPVTVITHQVAAEANRIYVIPPNASLTLVGDKLLLSPPVEHRGLRTPIDGFFMSLAEARGDKGAGVILSGSGSDGTLGLRAIKERGGLTLAQEGAEYDGMMRSAVRTGAVDFVLPLTDIPSRLVDYFHHLDGRREPQGENGEVSDHLVQICALLRTRTGHDFSGYRDKTVARRVQRRMQVLQLDSVPQFVQRLRKEPKEVDALLQDLLIGVTTFFRDPQAFAALEKNVIPRLYDGKGSDDTVRVWVPGCSTGEEAYSIAILLREHSPRRDRAPKLQIFASDIDEQALQIARTGRFPATIAKDVSPQRLEQYFVREDGTYRIASELREVCLFSVHNVLRDAPFSKLDLITCRNLLIYLTPEVQNRLIPLFHYALNDSGYLFLGSSENPSRHTRLFSTVDRPHRIFCRRPDTGRRLPDFPLIAPGNGGKRASPQQPANDQLSLQGLAERQLLERYSPAYVVINGVGDVLHGSGRTGKYLELPAGVPKTDVFSMARQGLRPDLRAGVHKAASSGQVTVQKDVVVGTNGGRQTIDLIVHPLRRLDSHDPLYMIVFQDIGDLRSSGEAQPPPGDEDSESASLRQMEGELRATQERLQSTTEELESANEELKSGNEELASMNEELQSANEELETSKEELQSINEELQTVNTELNSKVEELSRANSDIANLLESTQIATVFLDRNLHVKNFTPAAKDLFHLVESDNGRSITHVRARFQADTVQEDAERVLRTLGSVERQIDGTDSGARYIMRMMPYRTAENVIAGVVTTFVDISKITAAEARIGELTANLRNRISSLETLLDLLPVGILIVRDGGQPEQVRINRHGAQLLADPGREDGRGGLRLSTRAVRLFQGERELTPDEHPLQLAARAGQTVPNFEGELLRPDGTRLDVMINSTPLLDEDGKVRGGIAAVVDISERKHAEARQQVLLYELQHRVKNIIATISALATRTLRADVLPEQFSEAFLGRLRGMAVTHELLSRANWHGASLQQLIEGALRSHSHSLFDGSNIGVKGLDIMLTPNSAATLGMVFYELATNAAKYGALAVPGGRIDVSWELVAASPANRVTLIWTESGGKPVGDMGKPGFGKPGFGTRFVTRSIEYELQGTAEMEPSPKGIRWKLEFPVHQNVLRA